MKRTHRGALESDTRNITVFALDHDPESQAYQKACFALGALICNVVEAVKFQNGTAYG